MKLVRNKDADRLATSELLVQVSSGLSEPPMSKSWLGHSKGTGQLYFLLLRGSNMASMLLHRGAVRNHFDHLRDVHGIGVTEYNGTFKLTVPA